MSVEKVYVKIAAAVDARITCKRRGNTEWFERWTVALDRIANEYLPSGAGFDNGTKIDLEKSTPEKLVFSTSFHHMNGDGYYAGWTDHVVTVKPSFIGGFRIAIGGRDRNGWKEYAYDVSETEHVCGGGPERALF